MNSEKSFCISGSPHSFHLLQHFHGSPAYHQLMAQFNWQYNAKLASMRFRDTWVVQSVKCLTSAQVMISKFMSSSPTSGSLLSVQSLLRILCPPRRPYPCHLSLPLFLSKINLKKKRSMRFILRQRAKLISDSI